MRMNLRGLGAVLAAGVLWSGGALVGEGVAGARTGDPKRQWSREPTLYSGYCPNDPLQPSGLLGPVRVLREGPQPPASSNVQLGAAGDSTAADSAMR